MGYPGYISHTTSRTITNDFWLDDVRCGGNEASMKSCRHSGWGSHNCRTNEGIFLRCNAPGNVISNIQRAAIGSTSRFSDTSLGSSIPMWEQVTPDMQTLVFCTFYT